MPPCILSMERVGFQHQLRFTSTQIRTKVIVLAILLVVTFRFKKTAFQTMKRNLIVISSLPFSICVGFGLGKNHFFHHVIKNQVQSHHPQSTNYACTRASTSTFCATQYNIKLETVEKVSRRRLRLR